jgi:hypothetical protein
MESTCVPCQPGCEQSPLSVKSGLLSSSSMLTKLYPVAGLKCAWASKGRPLSRTATVADPLVLSRSAAICNPYGSDSSRFQPLNSNADDTATKSRSTDTTVPLGNSAYSSSSVYCVSTTNRLPYRFTTVTFSGTTAFWLRVGFKKVTIIRSAPPIAARTKKRPNVLLTARICPTGDRRFKYRNQTSAANSYIYAPHTRPSMHTTKKQKTAASPIQDLTKRALHVYPTSQRGLPPPLNTPPTFVPLKRARTQLDL